MSQPTLRVSEGFARCLRLVVALQCAGVAGRCLFSPAESESHVYGLLYFDWGWPEATALAIDNGGAWSCLVAGLVVLAGLARSGEGRSPSPWASAWSLVDGAALLAVAGWFFAIALAHTLRGGPFAEWVLAEHAVRYGTPIALLGLGRAPGPRRTRFSSVVLRVAVAATFTGHGYLALQHYGHFVDLILLTDARWFGLGVSQDAAEVALTWIGWIDVAVAAAVLLAPWRVPPAYAAFWGAVTATSRVTALGVAAWPETLLRAANCGAPLALALYHRTRREDDSAGSERRAGTADTESLDQSRPSGVNDEPFATPSD